MNSTKQNFEIMSDALGEYMNGEDGKKATIIYITDFGGYAVLPVRLHSIRFAPYAQYNEAMRIICTPKGKRNKCGLVLHSGKSFAIFADWVTPAATIGTKTAYGTMWSACDRNEFYKLVDSTSGEKLAEQSERLYIEELKQHRKIYKVYSLNSDKRGICTTYETESDLLKDFEKCGIIADSIRRYELQGTPILKGIGSAMWDGYDENGNACIRYETAEVSAQYD